MGQAIPTQHPAVVLRSHFNLVRALLAVATIAVVALAIAVVILAADGDEVRRASSSAPQAQQAVQSRAPDTRYDGGPNEGTRGIVAAPAPSTRYDGGPEEGTRGLTASSSQSASSSPGIRYDGGPEEGTTGPGN
jgi:hypothetical protein